MKTTRNFLLVLFSALIALSCSQPDFCTFMNNVYENESGYLFIPDSLSLNQEIVALNQLAQGLDKEKSLCSEKVAMFISFRSTTKDVKTVDTTNCPWPCPVGHLCHCSAKYVACSSQLKELRIFKNGDEMKLKLLNYYKDARIKVYQLPEKTEFTRKDELKIMYLITYTDTNGQKQKLPKVIIRKF